MALDLDGLPSGAGAFLTAMEVRYACKKFAAAPLGKAAIDYILECGRLSPSSFGLEPWRFAAVTDEGIRAELCRACLDQEAVGSAPLVVVILVHEISAYDPDSTFVAQRANRFPGGLPAFDGDYRGFYDMLASHGSLRLWARSQSYIACANMMTGAAAAGIDSCAIEGFEDALVRASLGQAALGFDVGIVVAFGMRAEEPRPKIREDRSSVFRLL